MLDVLKKLLPLSESSYWLTKVELLQTLGCLDFTILALQDNKLPENVLNGVVLKLLRDNDHRSLFFLLFWVAIAHAVSYFLS